MSGFIFPDHLEPMRLDKALALVLGQGLRHCRTLIEDGRVLVDGRCQPKGSTVRPGQSLRILDPAAGARPRHEVSIVTREGGFAALAKPGGLHTVAGRDQASLEVLLPDLGLQGWKLLNRLDGLTSGIVLAAEGEEQAGLYKDWQNAGQVRKWYLALARGEAGGLELTGRILDDNRRVVRVTGTQDEPLRWTRAAKIAAVDGCTLLLVRILKGRRHQIRAHLAAAGHPLVGDPVYGAGEPGGLFLHHWRVEMPGFAASLDPDWACFERDQAELVQRSFPPV